MKKIAITGASGYLGSALCRKLLKENYSILEIAHCGSHVEIKNECVIRIGQDNQADLLTELKKCSILLHAGTCYGRNGESVDQLIKYNTQLPQNLLNKALSVDIGCFINIGSCLPSDLTPYSLSKKHFWDWAALLCKDKSIKSINIKLEHFYGEGGSENNFITRIIRECLSENTKINLTDGLQKRDFIHIDDVVEAIMLIVKKEKEFFPCSSEFEVGTGKTNTVRSVVEKIANKCDAIEKLKFGVIPRRKNEPDEISVDISGLTELGWQSKIHLEEGLSRTIQKEQSLNKMIV